MSLLDRVKNYFNHAVNEIDGVDTETNGNNGVRQEIVIIKQPNGTYERDV